MAIRNLTTYNSDPNYQVDQLTNFSRLMAALGNSWHQRQDRQQTRDLTQIRYLLGLAQQEPDLAANPQFYSDVTKRYSKNFPEVQPLLDTLKNRGAVLTQAKAAGQKYLDLQGQMQQAHDGLQQQLSVSDDTLPNGSPNLDKAILRGQLMQLGDPASYPQRAMQQLTPEERSAATLYQKTGGYQLPKQFDPFRDMTPEQKTLYAGQTGLLGQDSPALQAAQYTAGLKMSPKAILESAMKDEAERAKAKASMDLEDKRFQDEQTGRQQTYGFATKRLTLQDQLERGRMGLGVSDFQEKYDYTHPDGPPDPSKVTYKEILQGVQQAQSDYGTRLKQATIGAPKGQVAAIRAQFVAQNGPRPAPIPPAHAQVIALRAEEAGGGDPEASQQTLGDMVSNYQSLRAAGKSATDALHAAQPGVPVIAPPTPPPAAPQTPPASTGSSWMPHVDWKTGSISFGSHPSAPPAPATGAQPGPGAPPAPPQAGPQGPGAPPPPGQQGAPAPPVPARMPGIAPSQGGQVPATSGSPALDGLVNATADTVRTHGIDFAKQILQQRGIQGPVADQILQAAQVAASRKALVAKQQSISAQTTQQSAQVPPPQGGGGSMPPQQITSPDETDEEPEE